MIVIVVASYGLLKSNFGNCRWTVGSFKLMDNLSANVQTEANAFGVEVLRLVQEAKHFEKLLLVIFTNTYTCVLNGYQKHVI